MTDLKYAAPKRRDGEAVRAQPGKAIRLARLVIRGAGLRQGRQPQKGAGGAVVYKGSLFS